MTQLNDQKQEQVRSTLRTAGVAVTAMGVLFVIIGIGSFFSAFNSFGPPRYFWCAFVGMPMIAIGSAMMRYGYMGAVTRYVAGEVAPVAKDTINYMADGTEEAVKKVGQAIGQGMAAAGQGSSKQVVVRCHKCNHDNSVEARFCSQCGSSLKKEKPCPSCNELNDHDAKFCDNCGTSLIG